MQRLLESPDDISLYLCENYCICLCAYEIGGIESGRGIVVVLTVGVAMVYVYPLKSPLANKHFRQTSFKP